MAEEENEEFMRNEYAAAFEQRMMNLFEKLGERVEAETEESRRRTEELRHRAEETQRNIDFIVKQQAQFVVDIQKLGEAQTRTDSIVERLATATLRRFEVAEGEVRNFEVKMEALVDSHIRLSDAHEKMAEAHKETDERLNTFIATVERIISARRNGGGRGEEKSE